ncbi:hypothetical protein GCM10007921_11610 [Tritonibacter mobilis]|nr:hypothetical protein GCM10007921_11610 [Tritonibacter mobilis]SDW65814.1 hypothetical protein SAMN05444385_10338 [Tritonibacter mobilis]
MLHCKKMRALEPWGGYNIASPPSQTAFRGGKNREVPANVSHFGSLMRRNSRIRDASERNHAADTQNHGWSACHTAVTTCPT